MVNPICYSSSTCLGSAAFSTPAIDAGVCLNFCSVNGGNLFTFDDSFTGTVQNPNCVCFLDSQCLSSRYLVTNPSSTLYYVANGQNNVSIAVCCMWL